MPSLTPLPSYAALLVAGPDARAFLQGQLSNDLQLLTPSRSLIASCNSAQGRVQAVLTVMERSDGIVLVLGADMAPQILQRLRKYVLRARVTLSILEMPWRILAAQHAQLVSCGLPVPPAPGDHMEREGNSVLHRAGTPGRYLVLTQGQPADSSVPDETSWRLADIRAGMPQVHPQTYERFVAQMLNLDLIGGISFDKGCYTGQEIIARTRYRGAIKRRMFRFATPGQPPQPGARILAGEQHAGDVVDAAPTGSGAELLAVISLAQLEQPLVLEGGAAGPLKQLELPYAVTTQ